MLDNATRARLELDEVAAMLRGIAAEWHMLESVDVPPTALLAVLDHLDALRDERDQAAPVLAAAFAISTYSPETLATGIQRLLDAMAEYEDRRAAREG